jgi:hypothetical protein
MIDREHFRRADDPWRADITQSIDLLKSQHNEIRKAVDENTIITNTIKANTDEIIEFFKAGKGFFKIAGYAGTIAKWLGAVAAAVTAIWAATHLGDK